MRRVLLPGTLAVALVACAGPVLAQQLVRQWVSQVHQASSQYEQTRFAAMQVIGAPDVTDPGRDGKDWSPAQRNAGSEWIRVSFARALYPVQLRIRETTNPGAVARIATEDSTGRAVTLWEGQDPTKTPLSYFEATLRRLDWPVRTITVFLDTSRVDGWNGLDAIEFVGTTGQGGPEEEPGGEFIIGEGKLLGLHRGSVLSYRVRTRTRPREARFIARVATVSAGSFGFTWEAGEALEQTGFRRVTQAALRESNRYDGSYQDEETLLLEDATCLLLSLCVLQEADQRRRSRIALVGESTYSVRFGYPTTANLSVNGAPQTVPVLQGEAPGGFRLTLLHDQYCPLVLKMETKNATFELVSLEGVTYEEGGAGPGPDPGPGNGEPEHPEDAGLPLYDTPQACFDAWVYAIREKEYDKLRNCYTRARRQQLRTDFLGLRLIVSRYRDALKDEDYEFLQQTAQGDAARWRWRLKVEGLFGDYRVTETIVFQKEGNSWRLDVQSD